MFANIQKRQLGYDATFSRTYNQPVEKVWSILVDNSQFIKWMEHLEIIDLKKDGVIRFHYNDESNQFDELKITDYEDERVLQFEWGEDEVRFELAPTENGCQLTFIELLNKLTEHTPKDVAGRHMCLDLFSSIVDGNEKEFSMDTWENYYEKYQTIIEKHH